MFTKGWENILREATDDGRLEADSPSDDIVEFVKKDEDFLEWCKELLLEHRDVDDVVDIVCLHLKATVRSYAQSRNSFTDR